jgi:DNA-binding MarR family transcriptional regulator
VLGLGPTDTKALDLLGRHGALTPKRLGELTGLAPASITGMVDRLQRRGFLERRAHPEDGRRAWSRTSSARRRAGRWRRPETCRSTPILDRPLDTDE